MGAAAVVRRREAVEGQDLGAAAREMEGRGAADAAGPGYDDVKRQQAASVR